MIFIRSHIYKDIDNLPYWVKRQAIIKDNNLYINEINVARLTAIVEDITDGNLANVEISMNFDGFIGNNPPIYTSKSFGVPGTINNRHKTSSTFRSFFQV